jgi:hypothetical protein
MSIYLMFVCWGALVSLPNANAWFGSLAKRFKIPEVFLITFGYQCFLYDNSVNDGTVRQTVFCSN